MNDSFIFQPDSGYECKSGSCGLALFSFILARPNSQFDPPPLTGATVKNDRKKNICTIRLCRLSKRVHDRKRYSPSGGSAKHPVAASYGQGFCFALSISIVHRHRASFQEPAERIILRVFLKHVLKQPIQVFFLAVI